MGIVIIAGMIVALAAAVLVAAVVRVNRRPVPAGWICTRAQPSGRFVGAACHCGRGQLQFMWRHGFGQVLRCSNYPVCRVAFRFDGTAFPEARLHELLQVR